MAKKSALGKGLNALLSSKEDTSEQIQVVNIEELVARADQPRKQFDDEGLDELAKSIKEHGIIQPLLVRKKGSNYEIIAGERRFRASKIAGLSSLPVIVRQAEDKQVSELSIIENIQRQDLNSYEEALAYKALMDNYDMTQNDLSDKLGKSRSYIANTIRLLKLDPKSLNELKKGKITSTQARSLLAIEDLTKRARALDDLVKGKSNIRKIEKIASKSGDDKKNMIIKDFEDKLCEKLSTNVKLNDGKKGGKIEISYYSYQDLERIIQLMGGLE